MMEALPYFIFWDALIFLTTRFGCGAQVMLRGRGHRQTRSLDPRITEVKLFKSLRNTLMVLPAIFASMPVLAHANEGGPGYWHNSWDWGWGHMAFGGLMMFAFWGGIIVLIVLAVRWIGGNSAGQKSPASNSAVDGLNERFARGEIEKEDYEDRKRLLSS